MNSEKFVREILKDADIIINGSRPWDVVVHNQDLYDRVLAKGTLGIGESYTDGWWDCQQIDELISKIRKAGVDKRFARNLYNIANVLQAKLVNLKTEARSKKVAKQHYDLGNDLYSGFLDP